MFDPSSFADPTPLAYADASRDVLPRRGTSKEIVDVLAASPSTNKFILTDDKDNGVVIPLSKGSKRHNPPAVHVMAFILVIPG
ncbi:hypothetical protein TNCV_4906031 [Trichonephila clavipes]|uniref:Uncharacterized protein n=1 Tax=Trichonephila clavipes TaxID=2585209 RepID=A0A8X6V7N9_TRICX|nr:hypothetical protein TNCV_4906031 [Trichonephila clavipes]